MTMPSCIYVTCKLHQKFHLAEKLVVTHYSAILKFSGKTRFGYQKLMVKGHFRNYLFKYECFYLFFMGSKGNMIISKTSFGCSNSSSVLNCLQSSGLNGEENMVIATLLKQKSHPKVSIMLKFPLLLNTAVPS